jgi:hypothetical protein
MSPAFTDEELIAYSVEALPQERMAEIEQALRADGGLRARMAALLQSQASGGLTVAEVWREGRLTCPTRAQWGSYLLGILEVDLQDYFDFHLQVIGCRYCLANLDDLRRASQAPQETQQRRQKFFQSSAGYMSRDE